MTELEQNYVQSLLEYIELANEQMEMLKRLSELQKQKIEELELENEVLNELIEITGTV